MAEGQSLGEVTKAGAHQSLIMLLICVLGVANQQAAAACFRSSTADSLAVISLQPSFHGQGIASYPSGRLVGGPKKVRDDVAVVGGRGVTDDARPQRD